MIISASRRTDIPALYSRWFMNRIRAGWCLVPNPLNAKQVLYVSLRPQEVDAIIFWSKNPLPILPHLKELSRRGFRYYFQFTLTDYPRELEPHLPSLEERLETFLNLSRRIGPLRVVWRYDPIIISNRTHFEFHRKKFSWIAEKLKGATSRVVISTVHFYQKTDRRLSQLEKKGFSFDRRAGYSAEMIDLIGELVAIARKRNLEIFTCAEEHNFRKVGILPGRCVDEHLLNRIWALNLRYRKDPGQRELCLCMLSRDIGINDTCIHGCSYCYSTRDCALARRRYEEHDPASPAIWNYSKPLESKVSSSHHG